MNRTFFLSVHSSVHGPEGGLEARRAVPVALRAFQRLKPVPFALRAFQVEPAALFQMRFAQFQMVSRKK